MAQTLVKELTYDGKKVLVELARRDGDGNIIVNVYATKTEVEAKLDTAVFTDYISNVAPAEYVAIENFKVMYLDKNNVAYKTDIKDFITKDTTSLVNYYLKSETYSQTEINSIISTLKVGAYQVVETLPTAGEEGVVYLVGTKAPYTMYIWENNSYLNIGSTDIDLSNYVTKEYLEQKLATKQNVLTAGNGITITDNVISTPVYAEDITIDIGE